MTGLPFIEIGLPDAERGLAFYREAFGWEVRGEGDARHFETADGPVGLHGGDDPSMVVYLPVPDLAPAIARVERAGGRVMGGVNDEPGFGRFATCADPQGVRFGQREKEPA